MATGEMAGQSQSQLDVATERFRRLRETAPFAASARYDAKSGRVIVELTNGATFAFPPHLLEGLERGTPAEFAEVQVEAGGYALHWESLDADFTVPGLLNGIFGTASWMAHQAGKSASPAKASAARANGAKGGRPRRAA